MLDIPVDKGQAVVNSFWDANLGLKMAKEAAEAYWESTGRKYVLGIDGRKIYVRSKHSLLNALFQSCGAILMEYSGNLIVDEAKKENLQYQRWGFFHDELQYYVPYTQDRSIFTWAVQDNKEEPAPDNRIWTKAHQIKEGALQGKWVRYYHRFGELCIECHRQVSNMFEMRVPLDGEYMMGRSWAETH